jgi:hypothetical protein
VAKVLTCDECAAGRRESIAELPELLGRMEASLHFPAKKILRMGQGFAFAISLSV